MSRDKKIRGRCRRCRRIDLALTTIAFNLKTQSKTVHAYCGCRYRYRTRTLLAFSIKRFVVRLVVWSGDQWFVLRDRRNKPWLVAGWLAGQGTLVETFVASRRLIHSFISFFSHSSPCSWQTRQRATACTACAASLPLSFLCPLGIAAPVSVSVSAAA